MFVHASSKLCILYALLVTLGSFYTPQNAYAVALPDPTTDAAPHPQAAASGSSETVVLAGGCFWGVESVFQHVKGVTKTVVGYSGGQADTAHYEMVSTGTTGHAESVEVTYDPAQVSFGQILKVFFGVAHDPTELNYQGPDHGTQYRSEIFFTTPAQQKEATDYVAQLQQTKVFANPIVTKIDPLQSFYPAEEHHQDYARLHPFAPYIVFNDAPKVAALEKELPSLYVKD